jgi:hypothetical protein
VPVLGDGELLDNGSFQESLSICLVVDWLARAFRVAGHPQPDAPARLPDNLLGVGSSRVAGRLIRSGNAGEVSTWLDVERQSVGPFRLVRWSDRQWPWILMPARSSVVVLGHGPHTFVRSTNRPSSATWRLSTMNSPDEGRVQWRRAGRTSRASRRTISCQLS